MQVPCGLSGREFRARVHSAHPRVSLERGQQVGAVEHLGSTAVPGMAAKPIIDIMAPVGTLAAARPAIGSFMEYARVGLGDWAADLVGWL